MQAGMIGLGRMGANMTRRLLRDGRQVIAYDLQPEAVAALAREGAVPAHSLAELVERLTPPRVCWLMLPAARGDAQIEQLAPRLAPGDTLVTGPGRGRSRADPRPRQGQHRRVRLPATCTADRSVPVILSRWRTTASNTA